MLTVHLENYPKYTPFPAHTELELNYPNFNILNYLLQKL